MTDWEDTRRALKRIRMPDGFQGAYYLPRRYQGRRAWGRELQFYEWWIRRIEGSLFSPTLAVLREQWWCGFIELAQARYLELRKRLPSEVAWDVLTILA